MDIWEDLDTLRFLQHGEYFPKLHQVIGIAYNSGPNATHGRTITSSNAYHKATEWFLHYMNSLVLFRMYTRSLETLELNVFITFSLLITIGEICMLKCETSLLGVNNVIERELPSPLNSSCFLHRPPRVMFKSWLWLSIFQSGSSLLRCWTNHHTTLTRLSYNRS